MIKYIKNNIKTTYNSFYFYIIFYNNKYDIV